MPDFLQLATAAIAAERKRQIDSKAFSAARDDGYVGGELDFAANAYFGAALFGLTDGKAWPWSKASWKSGPVERDLIRAGALWTAEIERLERTRPTQKRSQRLLSVRFSIDHVVRYLALVYHDRHDIGALAGAA